MRHLHLVRALSDVSGRHLLGASRQRFYANNREDAANIGFDDDFIYHEMALKPSERSKNMELLLPNEAINAFKMWEEKTEKTEY